MNSNLIRLADNLLASANGAQTQNLMCQIPTALEGIGLDFDNGAHVELHLFNDSTEANRVANETAVDGAPGMYRFSAVNGPVLFIGSIEVDDPNDIGPQFSLNDLASAFAGKE